MCTENGTARAPGFIHEGDPGLLPALAHDISFRLPHRQDQYHASWIMLLTVRSVVG